MNAIDDAIAKIEPNAQVPRRVISRLSRFLHSAVAKHETSQIFVAGLTSIDIVAFFDKIATPDQTSIYEPVLLIVYR